MNKTQLALAWGVSRDTMTDYLKKIESEIGEPELSKTLYSPRQVALIHKKLNPPDEEE